MYGCFKIDKTRNVIKDILVIMHYKSRTFLNLYDSCFVFKICFSKAINISICMFSIFINEQFQIICVLPVKMSVTI